MTTRVIVDAHAGWPVQVEHIDARDGVEVVRFTEIVEPGTKRDFHVWDDRKIVVTELRKVA